MADLFDKIKKGVNQGINTVTVKSKELMDSNKIKGEISTLQSRKSFLINEIGTKVYDMYKTGTFNYEVIKPIFSEITKTEENIKIKNFELDEIHRKAEEEIKNRQNENKNYCECGATLAQNAKFCTTCGKQVI